MAVLLIPQMLIDVAAPKQFLVAPDVVNLPLLHHDDRIAIHQHRKPVRHRDHRASFRDPLKIGVN